MTILFVTFFAIGVVAVVGSLLVGEVGGSLDGDGSPFLSLTTIATAIFGFGAGGLGVNQLDLATGIQIGAGVATAAVLVLVFRGLLLPYILRQQSNSHFGRTSYIGAIGRVEMTIPVDGWGEVSLTDPTGSRVRVRAVSDETSELPIGSQVYVADVDAHVIRVVSVPELE